jgi:hypothetical protein
MQVSVGTFNLNNLFSRFDFSADISTAKKATVATKTVFSFDDPSGYKLRSYRGTLVKPKPDAERLLLATRIKRMDIDVLGVQEVEDIDTLKQFNRDDLGGLYSHAALIEENDPRISTSDSSRSSRWAASSPGSTSPIPQTPPNRCSHEIYCRSKF